MSPRRGVVIRADLQIAEAFHEAYERLAPGFSYKTREASAVPWKDVPHNNQALMVAVVRDLLDRGLIAAPDPGRCHGRAGHG